MTLDGIEFNAKMFFPRPTRSEAPEGAMDSMIEVEGATLHLRTYHAENARCLVLFFHGNGEVVRDYDDNAGAYADMGCSLAVLDYRGYGMSTGRPTLRAIIEDAPIVLRAVKTSLPIVVMGRSLGSACANELYGRSDVAGFVLESGFVDLEALASRRGVTLDRVDPFFDPIPKLARGTQPLLVLHGERDTLIVPEEGKRAFEAAGTREKEIVIVPDRGHNDISFSPVYWRALADFISRATAHRAGSRRDHP